MKRGGSLDNQLLFYTVSVIAILNLIAYLSVGDWRSMLWFAVSGICMFVLTTNQSISILVAILGGAVCRSVYIEGMAADTDPKKSDKTVKKGKTPDPMDKKPDLDLNSIKDIMSGSNLEGLANQAEQLTKKNNTIADQIKDLRPMMSQMTTLVDKLPEGFLAEAMKNFNRR